MAKVRFFERKEKKLLQELEREPSKADNFIRLGKLYFLNGDYDRAVDIYQRGLKVAPRDISLLFNYAVTREAQKEIDSAKELYLEILSINPNDKLAQEHLDKITDF
ncbi:MAG: tetratricopeptide repeat protein [PVC group bacterium]